MGRFPIIRTELVPSGRAPVVRADIDVRTGEEAVGQAIGQAAIGAVRQIAKYNAMEGKAQADTAVRDARLSMMRLLNDIRQEDDVSKWNALFEAHTSRVSNLTPKHAGGQRQYKAAINRLTPFWQNAFNELMAAKIDDNMIAASMVKVDNLLKSATSENMNLAIQKIKTELMVRDRLSPSVSRAETEAAKLSVVRDVQLSAAKREALKNPKLMLEMIKGDIISGFDALTPDDVLRVRSVANSTLAQGHRIREAEINAEQGRLMALARTNQLTDDIVRASMLDEFGTGSKKTFYDIIDRHAKAALAEKEEPFTKSDPTIEARILDQVRDPESLITEKDISELVGKGLSIDDADKMIRRLDVFKSFWFVRADKFLKDNLGWSETYIKWAHPEGALSYHLAMDKLFDEIDTKNLKGKDIYDTGKEIAIPYVIDYWEKVLIQEPQKIERLTALLKGEPKPKTKKRPPVRMKKIIDPEGIF